MPDVPGVSPEVRGGDRNAAVARVCAGGGRTRQRRSRGRSGRRSRTQGQPAGNSFLPSAAGAGREATTYRAFMDRQARQVKELRDGEASGLYSAPGACMTYLFVYDIEDDRLRGRIAKILEGYGLRVQESVFECVLRPEELDTLEGRLLRELRQAQAGDRRTGNIRIYRVCADCLGASRGIGSIVNQPGGSVVHHRLSAQGVGRTLE